MFLKLIGNVQKTRFPIRMRKNMSKFFLTTSNCCWNNSGVSEVWFEDIMYFIKRLHWFRSFVVMRRTRIDKLKWDQVTLSCVTCVACRATNILTNSFAWLELGKTFYKSWVIACLWEWLTIFVLDQTFKFILFLFWCKR